MVKKKSTENGHAVANFNIVRRNIFQIANMRSAMKGFEATDIWPTTINVFKEDDFLHAVTTDISILEASATAPEDPALNFSP